ncbi:MAG: transporter substrate-binding domain-containing protein, partial [Nocardioidaceae bacterium]
MENPGWSRRDFLRRSMFAGGLVVAPGLLSACQTTDTGGGAGGRLEQLRSAGTISVGIAGEEPYGYLDGGELTGGDPAVQQAIWTNLGIETVKATQIDFDSLIPALNAGRFDVVAAGMFITPERCLEAEFSEPMYCAPNAFLVPEGNPDNISDFASVADAGIKLAVLGGAVEGPYAEDAGVPKSD